MFPYSSSTVYNRGWNFLGLNWLLLKLEEDIVPLVNQLLLFIKQKKTFPPPRSIIRIIIIRGRLRRPHQTIIIIYKQKKTRSIFCCHHIGNGSFIITLLSPSHSWFPIPPPPLIIVDRLIWTRFIKIIIKGRHRRPCHIVNGLFKIPLPLLLDYCSRIPHPQLIIIGGIFLGFSWLLL